jgi:type II secretory pathway pseudopilin PulG
MGYCALGSMEAHRDMNKHQRIGIRIAISASVGILVAAIALVVAWYNFGGRNNFWPEQRATRLTLRGLDLLIEVYKRETKALPASLADLRRVRGAHVQGGHITYDYEAAENGSPLDGWGHPFVYSVDGTNYTIVSYGRDGKPGGAGPDCDLSNVAPSSKGVYPTFAQFIFNPLATGILFTCFLCGIAAFWLTMSAVNPTALHGWALAPVIAKLVATILGTLGAAFFMSVFHIPNYH